MTGHLIDALEFCTHYRKFLRLPATWSWGTSDQSINSNPISTAVWEGCSAANIL